MLHGRMIACALHELNLLFCDVLVAVTVEFCVRFLLITRHC